MKKMISILLCALLLISSALAEKPVAESVPGEKLGFELLKKIYAEGENSVLSPLSLALALGMAAEGAEGETLAQLLEALGAENADELAQVTEEIRSANAVFVQPGFPVKEDYVNALAGKYAPEWFEIDDQTVDRVNAWVNEHTDGLIDKLMDDAPASDIAMLLINAVALDADWALPFMKEATYAEIFHAPSGDVEVEMMHQTEYFHYAEKDGLQIIRLPYAGSDLDMWIALPAEGVEMEALLDSLAANGMAYLTEGAANTEVVLTVPKLDISDSHSLVDLLKKLGLSLPFGDDADFSGISEVPLCIDEIIQKARMQVDENGTKAAAATMVAMRCMALAPGMKPEPVVMKLDRPYFYAITDSISGAVCFTGVVENPAG